MKNRDIIRAIRKEANAFIPDMKSEVMANLPYGQTVQPKRERKNFYKRPIFAVAAIVLCISVALILTYFLYTPETTVAISDSYISIDINPSIEITADKNDMVKSVRAMNTDGAVLIFGEDFSEMTAYDACVKIVSLAIEAEYISAASENAIKIVGINDNQEHETALANKINNRLQTYLTENSISANIDATTNPSNELREAAKKNKVTVGKMELINELRNKYPEISFEEAKKKSVKEINELLKNYDEEAISEVNSILENEYSNAQKKKQNKLQSEISDIETKYDNVLNAINNILTLIENENANTSLLAMINNFNSDFPEHKYNGTVSIENRQIIKTYFQNLLEQLQSSMNREKQEKQENADIEARKQAKNKWKNSNTSD